MKTTTITAISKMIASGDIPKEIYDKYLSKTKLGFCTEEKVEEIIIKEATQDDKKIMQILKEKKVDLEQIRQYILWKEKFEKISINKLCLTYNRGKKKNRQLTEEEAKLIVEWIKEV